MALVLYRNLVSVTTLIVTKYCLYEFLDCCTFKIDSKDVGERPIGDPINLTNNSFTCKGGGESLPSYAKRRVIRRNRYPIIVCSRSVSKLYTETESRTKEHGTDNTPTLFFSFELESDVESRFRSVEVETSWFVVDRVYGYS